MSQLQVVEPEIVELGYQIVGLSPDSPASTVATVEKARPGYLLLSDAEMDAARAFGISFQVDEGMFGKLKSYGIDLVGASGRHHKQLPVPSIFVVGTDGVIHFQYVNPDYKLRLAPEVLLEVARHGAARNPRSK